MNVLKNQIFVFLAFVQTLQEAFNVSVHRDLFYRITGEDVMVSVHVACADEISISNTDIQTQ